MWSTLLITEFREGSTGKQKLSLRLKFALLVILDLDTVSRGRTFSKDKPAHQLIAVFTRQPNRQDNSYARSIIAPRSAVCRADAFDPAIEILPRVDGCAPRLLELYAPGVAAHHRPTADTLIPVPHGSHGSLEHASRDRDGHVFNRDVAAHLMFAVAAAA